MCHHPLLAGLHPPVFQLTANKDKRWCGPNGARAKQLRDHPLCAMCLPRLTPATICDHVNPKDKLDPELFFTGAKQSLCKTHHDSTKQREEKRGHAIGCDPSGLPIDTGHHWNGPSHR